MVSFFNLFGHIKRDYYEIKIFCLRARTQEMTVSSTIIKSARNKTSNHNRERETGSGHTEKVNVESLQVQNVESREIL